MEYIERLKICESCPIYKDGICNNRLYLNPLNGDISRKGKDGYIKGCGCRVDLKAKHSSQHCPAKKW